MQGQVQIPFTAVVPFTLQKVQHTSDERGIYITLLASDTEIDRQGDIMELEVLKSFAESAKQGKVKLRRNHFDSFYIANSVDGELVQTPQGSVQLYITFKAEDIGGTYYPEILHLLKLFKTQGVVPMQASVGGWITEYETVVRDGRLVRVIKKAELEHVSLTPPDGAVNPRTRVLEVLVKSFVEAINRYESGMVVMKGNVSRSEVKMDEKEKQVTPQTLLKEIERCALERRRLSYTKSDVEALYERAKRFGINPSPLGNILKPEFYLDVDEFADPVNYFFPLKKEHISAGIDFARQHPQMFFSLYDYQSAQKVYTNLVSAALEKGISVKFSGLPADALLPEELASKLEGFNPEVYNTLKSWAGALTDYYTSLVSGLYDEILSEEDNYAQLLAEMEMRSSKYGYPPAPNAKLKPHKLFANLPLSKFADPVGYLFPITPEWVIHSYRAFRYSPVRELYSPNAQKFIYDRILKGLERIGALIPFEPEFELNKHFAKRRVFIGNEDYISDDDYTPVPSHSEETLAKSKVTHSALIAASQLQADKELDEEFEEMLLDLPEPMKKDDATLTMAEAPKFPFVIGAKFKVPSKSQLGIFTIHPAFVQIPGKPKTPSVTGLGIIAGTELARKLGLTSEDSISNPKEIKLKWVGPKNLKTPIAVINGKEQGGKEVTNKVPEVGFKVVGGLQAIYKGDVISEWVVLSNGTVIETNFIGWQTPVILRKDKMAIMDIGRFVADEIMRLKLTREHPYVSAVGVDMVAWGDSSGQYLTPIKITDDGQVIVYPAKIPAIMAHIPAPDYSEEVSTHIVSAFIAAVARQLGEDHEWVREAETRYAATEPEEPEEQVDSELAQTEEPEEIKEPVEEEEISAVDEEEIEERAAEELSEDFTAEELPPVKHIPDEDFETPTEEQMRESELMSEWDISDLEEDTKSGDGLRTFGDEWSEEFDGDTVEIEEGEPPLSLEEEPPIEDETNSAEWPNKEDKSDFKLSSIEEDENNSDAKKESIEGLFARIMGMQAAEEVLKTQL